MVRQFTRFRDVAFCGVQRDDGGALAAGCEDGRVQVFDAHSRTLLRSIEAHARACHAVAFCPRQRTRLASGGDDTLVRLWDVTSGSPLARWEGHSDYVRALVPSPVAGGAAGGGGGDTLWASGGYDHTVKLWDPRAGNSPVMSLRHGHQVEGLAFFPSGGILASVGGPDVCLWDLVGGGCVSLVPLCMSWHLTLQSPLPHRRILRRMRPHAKDVTCITICPSIGPPRSAQHGGLPGSGGTPRMLTGSLDGSVKVFELDTFAVTHCTRYPAPVLSVAVAPDASAMAVGCANGTLALRRRARSAMAAAGGVVVAGKGRAQRQPPPNKIHLPLLPRSGRILDAGSYRYFIRGQGSRPSEGDLVVSARHRTRLAPFDAALRRFKHRDALDAALATRAPAVVAAVLDALAQRGALLSALAGRDAPGLVPLLHFLARHVTQPRHCRLLASVTARVLDIYTTAVGADPGVDAAFANLAAAVAAEVQAHRELMALQGALEPLLAAALRGR